MIYHLHHHSTLYYQAGELLVNHMLRSEDFSTVSTVFFCVKKIIRMVHQLNKRNENYSNLTTKIGDSSY